MDPDAALRELPLLASLKDTSRRDLNAEARIQAAIVEWARVVAPSVVIFAIPNGGLRSRGEAARLKWCGVLAGVFDLAVITAGGQAYFLETKTASGALSADQRAFATRLKELRAPFAIVRSIDDARAAFAGWGIPTREARR